MDDTHAMKTAEDIPQIEDCFANDACPLTLTPLSDLAPDRIFALKRANGLMHGYEAEALHAYLLSSAKMLDPLTSQPLSMTELAQLDDCARISEDEKRLARVSPEEWEHRRHMIELRQETMAELEGELASRLRNVEVLASYPQPRASGTYRMYWNFGVVPLLREMEEVDRTHTLGVVYDRIGTRWLQSSHPGLCMLSTLYASFVAEWRGDRSLSMPPVDMQLLASLDFDDQATGQDSRHQRHEDDNDDNDDHVIDDSDDDDDEDMPPLVSNQLGMVHVFLVRSTSPMEVTSDDSPTVASDASPVVASEALSEAQPSEVLSEAPSEALSEVLGEAQGRANERTGEQDGGGRRGSDGSALPLWATALGFGLVHDASMIIAGLAHQGALRFDAGNNDGDVRLSDEEHQHRTGHEVDADDNDRS